MGILARFFGRAQPQERRSSGTGYTALVMAGRADLIAGRSGLAELTATAASAVALWEGAMALAAVTGTDLLTRRIMALVGRSLALRGEALFLVREDRLVPCADWDLSTRDGEPRAYRLSVSEAGGGRSETALAGECLHFRINSDAISPWTGSAPLRRASLSAGLLHSVEAALAEVFAMAPLGSQVVPFPESPEISNEQLGRSFRGQYGRVLLRESVNVTSAGGPVPQTDWRPASLSPALRDSMAIESWEAARNSVAMVFGVLPALLSPATTGPMVREAQRHLATWTLQPIAELIAEECTQKLGTAVAIDVLTPTQAFDAGGAARAVASLVGAMVEAKTAGLSPAEIAAAFQAVDWREIVRPVAPAE
jgi:hypothetical protein